MLSEIRLGGLLPCPFCGGQAIIINAIDRLGQKPRYRVECYGNCYKYREIESDAVAVWNKRAEQ
jgi:Lar family restriction alleviation protein